MGKVFDFTIISHFFITEFGMMFIILLAVMGIEYITFLLTEAIQEVFHWKRAVIKAGRKVIILSIVVLSYYIDQLLQTGETIQTFSILFYIFYDAHGVLRNAHRSGIPLPPILAAYLERLKNLLKK